MSGLAEYYRFWPYAVALIAGAIFAVIDRRVIGRYVLAALLVLIVAGGQLGMYLSPFTFQGGDYYMTSLIASVLALAGLAGYALSMVANFAWARLHGGRT